VEEFVMFLKIMPDPAFADRTEEYRQPSVGIHMSINKLCGF
jgi:hypothetical protein